MDVFYKANILSINGILLESCKRLVVMYLILGFSYCESCYHEFSRYLSVVFLNVYCENDLQ